MIEDCTFSNPLISTTAGTIQPSAANENFLWGSSTCTTTGTGMESIAIGLGFLVFILSFYIMYDIFNIKRYDR